MSDAPIKGTPADWLSDRAVRALIGTALLLPLRPRLALMGGLVSRGIAPAVGWRRRAMANLAHVWPDLPETDRRRIADASADNAGRTMIENYDVAGLRDRMANVPLTGEGAAEVERARAEGRPVMFVTGHFGNYEAPRAALVARGYRVGGLYRPMKNPYFNAHYGRNMHQLSGPVFEQGRRGTTGLFRHMKEGGMAVLLFDVFDGKGAVIDFLGRPAPTALSAAEIALRTGALMIPFFGVRQPDGVSCSAEFEAPVPHGDPIDMMRAATQRLEARIAAHPGQWFWIHRRWKPERQRRRAAERTGP